MRSRPTLIRELRGTIYKKEDQFRGECVCVCVCVCVMIDRPDSIDEAHRLGTQSPLPSLNKARCLNRVAFAYRRNFRGIIRAERKTRSLASRKITSFDSHPPGRDLPRDSTYVGSNKLGLRMHRRLIRGHVRLLRRPSKWKGRLCILYRLLMCSCSRRPRCSIVWHIRRVAGISHTYMLQLWRVINGHGMLLWIARKIWASDMRWTHRWMHRLTIVTGWCLKISQNRRLIRGSLHVDGRMSCRRIVLLLLLLLLLLKLSRILWNRCIGWWLLLLLLWNEVRIRIGWNSLLLLLLQLLCLRLLLLLQGDRRWAGRSPIIRGRLERWRNRGGCIRTWYRCWYLPKSSFHSGLNSRIV